MHSMASRSLNDLPVEILERIVFFVTDHSDWDYDDRPCLLDLSVCSRTLNAVATPFPYADVAIVDPEWVHGTTPRDLRAFVALLL